MLNGMEYEHDEAITVFCNVYEIIVYDFYYTF